MKYQKKPVIVDAVQWNKHGDHPEVVRPDCSKHPKGTIDGLSLCSCGALGYQHGLLCDSKYWKPVCPGSYIYATPGEDRTHKIVDKADFEREFEPVKYQEPVLFPDDPELDAVTRMWHYYQEKYKILWPNHPERMKAAEVYECREIDCCDIMNGIKGHPEPRVGSVMLNWPNGLTREKVNEVYANKEGS